MLAHGGGAIVNLASVVSKIAVEDRFAYAMSKGAVLTMTLSVARDFINDGIRCNCVCPARVHTPFVDGFIAKNYPGREKEMFAKLSAAQPIGRMGQPEEVAALVAFLCSGEAAFITGSSYDIDGGVTLLR
jgi:NAD(P)-dependent dehydrogenase (short-subunit alcohol dehydrogenase family)